MGTPSLGAFRAAAEDRDLVPLGLEAGGEVAFQGQVATGKLKDPAAEAAEEVVVMLPARGLVARGFAGKGHRGEKALLHQALQGAVHGGQAQGGHLLPGEFQDLLGGKGAARLEEGLPDGPPLPCGALHAPRIAT